MTQLKKKKSKDCVENLYVMTIKKNIVFLWKLLWELYAEKKKEMKQ